MHAVPITPHAHRDLGSRGSQEEGFGIPVPGPHFWDPSLPLMAVSILFPENRCLCPVAHPLLHSLPLLLTYLLCLQSPNHSGI